MANTKRLLEEANITAAITGAYILKKSAEIDGSKVNWNVLKIELSNGDDVEIKLEPLQKQSLFYFLEYDFEQAK